MTSEGLGEMFEGDSADVCAGKFLLISMGGQAEGLASADPEARTPIGALNCHSPSQPQLKLGVTKYLVGPPIQESQSEISKRVRKTETR